MKKLLLNLLNTSILAFAVLVSPAAAQDNSAGKAVESPEISRAAGTVPLTGMKSAAPSKTRSAGQSADRSIGADVDEAVKSHTLVGRSRDGKELRIEPGEDVLKAIKGEKKAENNQAAPKGAADPIVEEEGSRAVVGADNRLAVSNTKKYPFVTVGYLEATHTKSKTTYSCTASLIGPSTIVTAAQCVFDHNLDGGWFDEINFWPAINGEENIPFGGFDWLNAYVFEGYVTEYDGTYDSIWPYDVAIIELAQPAGDQLGWLGYGYYPDIADFQANLVGYQSDKPSFTQWRASCDVLAENISELDFMHDCDAEGWSTGAPIYFYDSSDKSRRIVGMNMGTLGNTNWALRISDPIAQWLIEMTK